MGYFGEGTPGFELSNGSYTTISDPYATGGTVAQDINNAGQIVGYYYDGNGAHGFLDTNGSFITLDDPKATGGTFANGINNNGQIVGYYYDGAGQHGFLYSGGIYTTLDDPLATAGTGVRSINDSGQIVGWYYDSSGAHGFVATTTPPTSTISEALLNDTGVSQIDLITSDGHVTVTGKAAEQINSVQIWNAVTNTMVGSATIAGDGEAWSYSGSLAEGNYQLYAKLTDLAGNVGQTSSQPTIVVDKTAPVPVMLDAVYNPATNLTTLSGASEANNTVLIYDGTTLVGTVTTTANGTWSLLVALSGKGIHSFAESSTDLAGNTGPSAGVTLFSQTSKQLTGGTGNDVVIGGPNDTLKGGSGFDTFVFNMNFGKETIKDFNVLQDELLFDHGLFVSATAQQVINQAHNSSAGAVIVVDAGDTVTLTGVSGSDLQNHLSDIHFF